MTTKPKAKPDNTGKQQKKDTKFKPGQSGNPSGRPLGALGFKTIFEQAVKKIAKEKNLKESEIEVDLIIQAITKAKGGNYHYYRDIFDRIYGRPVQKIQGDEESPLIPSKIEITFKEK